MDRIADSERQAVLSEPENVPRHNGGLHKISPALLPGVVFRSFLSPLLFEKLPSTLPIL